MSAEFPLRPQTLGEVLDAGATLLRRRPSIIVVAMAFAGAEQVLVRWLARTLDISFTSVGSVFDEFGAIWEFVAIGMACEAVIFGIVGAWSARTAVALVADEASSGRAAVALRRRWLAVIVVSLLVGAGAGITFFIGGLLWIFWFMLTALVTPTLVIEGGAGSGIAAGLLRAIRLAARGLAAGRVRLLAYLPWLLVRLLLLVAGADSVAGLLSITNATVITIIGYVLWIVINGLLYATIASVDAASYLETRIRTEGLDIAIGRAARTGARIETVLAVPR